MNNASPDLQWMVIRNNSCFLKKGNDLVFSTEPNNLKNRNTFKYNGLIHKRTVGIESCSDGKGIVLVTKTGNPKPSKMYSRRELKKDARRSLTAIRNALKKNKYRSDLKNAALRRASAILRSQKPVGPLRKKRTQRNKRN
jgi:large subunit ribosomal protein L28e